MPPAADVARLLLAAESPDPLEGDLGDLPGVVRVDDVPNRRTDTTYYDTPDLRLTREGAVLLRRRGAGGNRDVDGGGSDENGNQDSRSDGDGWSLLLPALSRSQANGQGPARRTDADPAGAGPGGELLEPLGADDEPPPARLARLARALVRGAPLVAVATVRTEGRTHRLLGPDGEVVAELRDDHVEAQGPFGPARRRRLLTVTGPDDPAVRTAVGERLAGLGATPTSAEPDVTVALGPYAAAEPDVPRPPASISRRRAAAELVAADLRAHVRALLHWEAPVQLDQHDAVHKMRVSVRRLRSSLRTFGPLLDAATVDRLEPELSWLAASLGGPRDAEVVRERLLNLIGALPANLRRGDIEADLTATLDERHRQVRAALLGDLDTARYRQLLVDVVVLAARPPVLPAARGPIAEVVPPLLQRAWRKLDRRVRRAAATEGDEADLALHGARKSAKQLRYAAEACIPAYGRRAQRLAAQAEATQEVLGEHQDSVVSEELLVELADDAARRGHDTFAYGLMVGEERRRAERSRRAFGPVWKETSRTRHRRWLGA